MDQLPCGPVLIPARSIPRIQRVQMLGRFHTVFAQYQDISWGRKCNPLFWFEGDSVQVGGVDPNIQYSS